MNGLPKTTFFVPTPIKAKISRFSPCSRSMTLGSAKSEHPWLTKGEIIFEDFQPM